MESISKNGDNHPQKRENQSQEEPPQKRLCKGISLFPSLYTTEEGEKIIEQTKKEIEAERPTAMKIAFAPTSSRNKREYVRLFQVLESLDSGSKEYLDLEKKLRMALEYASKRTPEKVQEIEDTVNRIESLFQVEIMHIYEKIFELQTDDRTRSLIYRRYLTLIEADSKSFDYQHHRDWLEWAIQLPYDKVKKGIFQNLDLSLEPTTIEKTVSEALVKVKTYLDKKVYGMAHLKEEFLIYIHDLALGISLPVNHILLVGNPGCGKTTICQALAEALEWPFYKISCSSIEIISDINGQKSWLNSKPGLFVQALCSMGAKNGIIFIDEFHRMSDSSKLAFFEILSQMRRHIWRDGFLSEIPLDMSRFLLVFDSSSIESDIIPTPSKAYFQRINIPPYNGDQKVIIIWHFILPQILQERGLSRDSIQITKKGIKHLIEACEKKSKNNDMQEIQTILRAIISRIHMFITTKDFKEDLGLSFFIQRIDKTPIRFPIIIDENVVKVLYNIINQNEKNGHQTKIEDHHLNLYI